MLYVEVKIRHIFYCNGSIASIRRIDQVDVQDSVAFNRRERRDSLWEETHIFVLIHWSLFANARIQKGKVFRFFNDCSVGLLVFHKKKLCVKYKVVNRCTSLHKSLLGKELTPYDRKSDCTWKSGCGNGSTASWIR
jgi:hypothetical protein